MISRRTLLGTGAATVVVAAGLGAAGIAHRLDDVARRVGIQPHPEPVASDDRLIAAAAADQNALLGSVEATASAHSSLGLDRYVSISTTHARAVGGAQDIPDIAAPPADQGKAVDALATAYADAAKSRAADSQKAVSPDLVRVLVSMSAGLSQCARSIGDLR